MNRPILALSLAVAVAGCTAPSRVAKVAESPVPVRVAAVEVERVAPSIRATGLLRLKDEVTLSFKVGGIVQRVGVDEGQAVRAGQVLASLDLGEVEPAVARAQSAADKAQRDLARARRLLADSVATPEQVQDAETAWNVARAELQSVAFNRRHAEIVAPAAGVILRRAVEPGELVGAGQPVLTLGSEARGVVLGVGLADRDAVQIHRGDLAEVRFEAYPGRHWEGRVTERAAQADPATGTYEIEIALPADAPRESGLVGAAEIHPGTEAPMAMVPVESVLEADGSRGSVFVLGPDLRAVRREVTLAFLSGDRVAVAAGLGPSDRVITAGSAYLDNGRRVEVKP